MRATAPPVLTFLLGIALLPALALSPVNASEIKGLQLSSGATGTRAEIALDAASDFRVLSLKGPDRLAIDLADSRLTPGVSLPAGSGVVSSVRTGQPVAGTVRIVFDLNQSVTAIAPRIEPGANGPKLVVEWPHDGAPAPAVATVATSAPVPPQPAAVLPPAKTDAERAAESAAATSRLISELAASYGGGAAKTATPSSSVPTTVATGVPTRIATGQPAPVQPTRGAVPPADSAHGKTLQQVMRGAGMRPLIVAIDAGHGGQDPGAIGLAGKREKDITLAIARELARQVDATPGLKSYLTRDNDVFLPLTKRTQLARANRADIFVSLHADAAENRNAKGSSVYVLSLRGASSQRARWLADKENSADLIGGARLPKTDNTLTSVLLDLTQSGHMRASEDAAGHVLSGLKKIGNNHKPQVERANFAVLRTSDMPAMLVETAFLSNPEEEKRLTDPAQQRVIARAVLDGINTYFTRQPPPGTMFAARAEAQYAAPGGAGGSP
ncbi:MAG: N-acetylmuramoyl-L-alanine amidase [Lysobacterales bacterium RIFOXYA1_FULL_69_10]|nr:MAG: N-acetylmuramoyl-L-alanine amidase [Xanthomonadales bacterium RIFOXYA1_FULL_69_10]